MSMPDARRSHHADALVQGRLLSGWLPATRNDLHNKFIKHIIQEAQNESMPYARPSHYADALQQGLLGSGWLPATVDDLDKFIKHEIQDAQNEDLVYHPVIQEFKDLIENDPAIHTKFIQMFKAIPQPATVSDYETLLMLLNRAVCRVPTYDPSPYDSNEEFSGFYIHAILMAVIVNKHGCNAFVDNRVHKQFCKIQSVWRNFYKTPASADQLTVENGGWLSPNVIKIFETYVGNFMEAFECDPDEPHWGFDSWDHFFTRAFRPPMRPLEFPDNPSIINSACESTVFRIAPNIQETDMFKLKQQNYSLKGMLDNDPLAPRFAGGTVYQAFLSTTDYQRWHSPVSGRIIKTRVVPGTYCTLAPALCDDDAVLKTTQTYLIAVATRAIVFIESDNPNIGLMCFIAVGTIEISSCEITVQEGSNVKRGDQLGIFHSGGSAHCLIFRPETKLEFIVDEHTGHVPLRSAIARALSNSDN
ncbi:phosphatidylserine decarboxylase-domain-containing protein [Crepidotus variabilis]|uniref:Phosphatidylserine decarboxylase-domain-containing protein n=1 Tax=Crepidotus variabilis TaxID=179855 RepID=A0A9P6ENP5_9AGAR|nr:phosphatidylserine decarboxylase-domain-containing protein [Crepidotus variabilis]